VIPRAAGCVLELYDRQWEDEAGLLPVSDPLPIEEWLAETRRGGYRVAWTPEGALADGPYRGGVVVEVADARGRSYVAVPPEALDRLREIMDDENYQRVREDAAALENPAGHGLVVTRLDRVAWEDRGLVVPRGDPLPVEMWARVIRTRRLRVGPFTGALLPLDSAWPAGRVVAVTAAVGAHPSYFAVPRGLARLVDVFAAETGGSQQAGVPSSSEG
jgi:hypothetical protein